MKLWWSIVAGVSVLLIARVLSAPAWTRWGERAEVVFPAATDLRVDRDIVYARYGGRSLHLDLYRPDRVTRELAPGVVVIRGGGFQHGDSHGYAFMASYLARHGFAAACIQYRTTVDGTFPAQVQDAKAAVRWLRANAAEYRVDPNQIGAIGGSAGGYLVAMLATSESATDLEGDGGNAGVSSRITRGVAMATPADFVDLSPFPSRAIAALELFIGSPIDRQTETRRRASPATYVTRNAAPVLLIHSDADPDVPHAQAVLLQRRYQQAGAAAELFTIPGAPHDPWNYARWFPAIMERARAFLKQH